ncbi:MAG TPA: acyl-CoA dehydrogenase family protein [Quisquiliibacterium sp.]|nr:acyl-CoA dehydrogenase family protein [Quisquiliibacterium sp.]HPA88167.1 acyl-CoA dehydrogenase family protein [Quisquiliibacterium sp.]HQN11853.1 acyl-CoA dehydrogenase family protein [Quisquiliibacterium sp.]HQP66347.1 acyl-CoA dehydrogenase family protein [Quisquiliibacterium sp.]
MSTSSTHMNDDTPQGSELQRMFADSAERLFSENVTKAQIERVERGTWPDDLWKLATDGGFTLTTAPEAAGGVGGTWADAYPILRGLGYWRVPLPLAETMAGAWLLAQAGLAIPDDGATPITLIEQGRQSQLAARLDGGTLVLDGHAHGVPWARHSRHAVVSLRLPDPADGRRKPQPVIALLALDGNAGVTVTPQENIAREPRDKVALQGARCVGWAACGTAFGAEPVWTLGALLRCAMMVGAAESVLAQSLQYASERVQFGKPIGSYQAIQHTLAMLAGEVGAARMATRIAFDAAGTESTLFDVAAAKVRAGEAATRLGAATHQVHGAIGFTYEHTLHFGTRRLWAWRADFGADAEWADALGAAMIAAGADGFWPAITARMLAPQG